jgi:hypothetical protein
VFSSGLPAWAFQDLFFAAAVLFVAAVIVIKKKKNNKKKWKATNRWSWENESREERKKGRMSQNLEILGDRQTGQDVRTQNVMACQAIANIVKSSLGPVGLDKVRIIMFFFITEFCSLSFCFLVAPCNKSLYKLDCRGFFAVKEILRLRETPFILATTISTWKQLSFAGHNAWKPIRFSCQRRICLSL